MCVFSGHRKALRFLSPLLIEHFSGTFSQRSVKISPPRASVFPQVFLKMYFLTAPFSRGFWQYLLELRAHEFKIGVPFHKYSSDETLLRRECLLPPVVAPQDAAEVKSTTPNPRSR